MLQLIETFMKEILTNVDIFFLVGSIAIGLLIGIAIGMTGIGGGALIQPSLIHILGLSPVSAVGTGLVFALITKFVGLISHLKLKTVNKSLAFYFLLGSIPGVLIASKGIDYLLKTYDRILVNTYIQVGMAIILLITSIILVLQMYLTKGKPQKNAQGTLNKKIVHRHVIFGIVSGFLIGMIIGSTSIGGGVLIIPIFLLLFKATAWEAVGTSIAVSLFISGLGGLVYLMGGYVQPLTIICLSIGSLPGVYFGSKLVLKIPERVLRFVVIIIVAASGISLFFGMPDH